MKNILRHREYVGSVEIDEHEGFLYGRVLGIQEKITYRAERADELVRLFQCPHCPGTAPPACDPCDRSGDESQPPDRAHSVFIRAAL